MKIYGDEKPSLEDLAQSGVKGMKWGVRRAEKRQARRDRNMQIKVARRNVATRQQEIHTLVRASNKAKDPVQRQKLDKLATKKAAELFNHPDQLTASRMTSGEKWVNGILIGGAVAGATALRVAAAR